MPPRPPTASSYWSSSARTCQRRQAQALLSFRSRPRARGPRRPPPVTSMVLGALTPSPRSPRGSPILLHHARAASSELQGQQQSANQEFTNLYQAAWAANTSRRHTRVATRATPSTASRSMQSKQYSTKRPQQVLSTCVQQAATSSQQEVLGRRHQQPLLRNPSPPRRRSSTLAFGVHTRTSSRSADPGSSW